MELGCLICQESFTVNVDCQATKCGHVFHKNCLVPWIQGNSTCPTCRAHSPLTSLYRIYFTANPSDQSLRTEQLCRDLTEARSKIRALEDRVNELRMWMSSSKEKPKKMLWGDDSDSIAEFEAFLKLLRDEPTFEFCPKVHKFKSTSAPAEKVEVSYIRVVNHSTITYSFGIPLKIILEYSVNEKRLRAFYKYSRPAQTTQPIKSELLPFHTDKDSNTSDQIWAKVSLKNHESHPALYLPSCLVLIYKSPMVMSSYGVRYLYELVSPE